VASSALRVVVVGAGIAGLVAALRLERSGARVTLLEARDRVGGSLARSPVGGFELERVACVLPRSAPYLRALLDELAIGDSIQRVPLERARIGAGARLLSTRSALRRSPVAAVRLARFQAVAEWLGARVDAAAPERDTRLDDRSVADLCRLYLGERACRELFAPLLASAFGLDAAQTSRELLYSWLGTGADAELSLALEAGSIPQQIAAWIPDLRLRSPVEAVLEGGRGVRLASGERLETDVVVVATGPHEALRLVSGLDHVERDLLASCPLRSEHWLAFRAGPRLHLAERIGWCAGGSPALFDVTPRSVTEASLWLARSAPGASPAEILELCDALVPGLAAGARDAQAFVREGAPDFGVGHFRAVARLRARASRRPRRGVALCGDYLVGPGAEASAASGERAALELLAQL